MARRRVGRMFVVLGAAALVASSCGGGDGGSADTSPSTSAGGAKPTTATTEAPGTTVPATPDGLVTEVSDVKTAVVQVLTEGSFRDPASGMQGVAGAGSGFLIDPTGVIVTNNHVVTGAGIIKVRVGGADEELPARILGVSECNDLAVLQLTDPGPYPYLAWHEGAITPPLEVYTAGFPLGDPEYTVTRGVVSKEQADGDSHWASVRHVVEHDANIQPGNSGGPLVGADGRVVGVNYAAADFGTGTMQYFAIAADLARPVVEQLRGGDDETIGINGEAFDDGLAAGIWVAGVAPGSPASEAGILPGDIITTLNGVEMSGGTMGQYCSVLRTATPGGAMSVEVYRWDTDEIWVGEINGRELSMRFSFADEFGDEVAADDPATDDPIEVGGYEWVTDDTGTIGVELPVAWGDRDLTPTDLGFAGGASPSIIAAPSLDAFFDAFTTPGMIFVADHTGGWELTIEDQLDLMAPPADQCTLIERGDYSDGVFGGQMESWNCGVDTLYLSVVTKAIADSESWAVVLVQATTEAHLEALDHILWTFNFEN